MAFPKPVLRLQVRAGAAQSAAAHELLFVWLEEIIGGTHATSGTWTDTTAVTKVTTESRQMGRTSPYSNRQRVDFVWKYFSHSAKTTFGRTAKTGSFIESMSSFIFDRSQSYLRS